MDAVFLGTCDVQGAVLYLNVFLAEHGMIEFAADVQGAFACELCVTLTMEAPFRCGVGNAIAQGVHRIGIHAHLDALSVLDVYGRTVRIGQRQTVEPECRLVVACEVKLSVIGLSFQLVDNLTRRLVADGLCLYEFHMRGLAAEAGHVAGKLFGDGDGGLCAVVDDRHGVSLS